MSKAFFEPRYCLETVLDVTEVTNCVRVNRDLNVKLFYNGSPLPQWFRYGRDCRLTKKKYDAKNSKLYQIRGRADVQYSRRAQKAQTQEKTNIIIQFYSIFTSSTL